MSDRQNKLIVGDSIQSLVLALYDINAFKVGKFHLKSGIISPFYIDLRVIVSHPKVLQCVANHMWKLIQNVPFDVICGVPYTAIPIASAISLQNSCPMVMRRKEPKSYGLSKIIEGSFKKGDNCVVIDDLITSGTSVFETIDPLTDAGLIVKNVVVLLDREQGGCDNLVRKGLNVYSVIKLTEFLNILYENGRITSPSDILQNNLIGIEKRVTKAMTKETQVLPFCYQLVSTELKNQDKNENKINKYLSYDERIPLVKNPIAKKLLGIMNTKKTNLCLSADVISSAELLHLADELGPYICCLKTHVDILEDFTPTVIERLKILANRHNFVIFEDRKFADIGNTVSLQYSKGMYHISDWADIVNCHILPGSGVVKGLLDGGISKSGSLLLVAEMSSDGSLAKGDYTIKSVQMAKQYSGVVIGLICQSRLMEDGDFIHFTPGVKSQKEGDTLGQQYNTPRDVIFERGSDIIIVGRGILDASDACSRVTTAKDYQKAGWDAYIDRISYNV